MPPEDSVFPQKSDGTQNSDPPAQQAKQTAPSGLSREEVAALMDEKIGPIQRSTEQLNQFLAGLQEQASRRIETPPSGATSEDWGTEFYNNPQQTVQKEIESLTQPTVRQVATTMGNLLLDKEKERISNEFGADAWDTYFEGPLSKAVANAVQEYPGSLMNPTAIQNAVKTIMGDHFADLVTMASKNKESKASGPDEEFVQQVSNRVVELTGGIRRAPNAAQDKLDDEESQEFLNNHFRETGTQLDPKRMARLLKTGNTIDDWQKANKELSNE